MGKDIRKILKLARAAQDLSQEQLAELSGVSQSLIAKIENGIVKKPSASVRISLAKVLQLPAKIFATDDEIDGQKRNKLRVVASRVQFLGGRPERTEQPSKEPPSHNVQKDDLDLDEEEIPF